MARGEVMAAAQSGPPLGYGHRPHHRPAARRACGAPPTGRRRRRWRRPRPSRGRCRSAPPASPVRRRMVAGRTGPAPVRPARPARRAVQDTRTPDGRRRGGGYRASPPSSFPARTRSVRRGSAVPSSPVARDTRLRSCSTGSMEPALGPGGDTDGHVLEPVEHRGAQPLGFAGQFDRRPPGRTAPRTAPSSPAWPDGRPGRSGSRTRRRGGRWGSGGCRTRSPWGRSGARPDSPTRRAVQCDPRQGW